MDGLIVIDKPAGPTSHDVVAQVRRLLRERRIGHTGTLDPLATGVLPLVIGRATRLARFLSGADKRYRATIRLGWATDSGDAEGRPLGEPWTGPAPAREAIDAALDGSRGAFLQQPPVFSAKKIGGVRSHELARKDATLAPLPRPVEVTGHRIDIVALDGMSLTVDVHCSAGFYVRALAHDLGLRTGVGAHLEALRRTASGKLTLHDAVRLEDLEADGGAAKAETALVPMSGMLEELRAVMLTEAGETRIRHGRDIGAADVDGPMPEPAPGEHVRLFGRSGALLALAERGRALHSLHPALVLV
jgi:tRNA pseudouridine55 synthase